MTISFEEFSAQSEAKRETLLAKITENYGPSAAKTMDEYVAFSAGLAPKLVGIDPENPDPDKVKLAVRSMALGFNQVLNTLFQPLPGKKAMKVSVDL